jgi:acetyltransferase-like isoleucine patch superfamily enzyme
MDDDLHHMGAENQEKKAKGIRIGKKVWIGSDAKILKGVEIGSGSVIAANSVVVSGIPENCLAGGIPARVLKTDINWN